MLPRGFLGTNADLLTDIIVIAIIITPFLLLYAFRLARQKRFVAHRNLHAFLIFILFSAVILFEVNIRLSGGSKIFFKESTQYSLIYLRTTLLTHILIAILSFSGWLYLEIKSWKSFRHALPGTYSYQHKKLGYLVFSGVVLTSVSGVYLYLIAFVFK